MGCNWLFSRQVGLAHPELIVGKTDLELPWPRKDAMKYRADDRDIIETNRPSAHHRNDAGGRWNEILGR